jgi:hypothetical protein
MGIFTVLLFCLLCMLENFDVNYFTSALLTNFGMESRRYVFEEGVVDGRASRDAACHAGGSGFDTRSRPDLRLVWNSCSFL